MVYRLILLLLPFFSQAQLRVAYVGDSFTDGCCVPMDYVDDTTYSWRPLTTKWIRANYGPVQEFKFGNGGEDIRTAMPDWHPQSRPDVNIDAALRINPDLIFIQMSGNHFMRNISMDSVKHYYTYIADTLNSLGVPFVFVSNLQRQTTVGSGNTYLTFLAEVQEINAWLKPRYPYQYSNVFDTMYNPVTQKPVREYLYADSLHWIILGYQHFARAVQTNTPILDSLAGYKKQVLYNTGINQVGDSIIITTAETKVKELEVLTSNDGVSFTTVSNNFYVTGKRFSIPYSEYVMIRIKRYDKTITITKRFTIT